MNEQRKDIWWFLNKIPPKSGRYVVIDTETTGLLPTNNNVIEISAVEIFQGKLTGSQYHGYLKPRFKIHPTAEEKNKLSNTFYDDYYEDCYQSDKTVLENFLKFIGSSVIFAHNAPFDYNFINNELKHWSLPMIPKGRFRCSMRIYNKLTTSSKEVRNFCKLEQCCEFFQLKSKESNFHSALFDAFMTARLICKMYEFLEKKSSVEGGKEEDKYEEPLQIMPPAQLIVRDHDSEFEDEEMILENVPQIEYLMNNRTEEERTNKVFQTTFKRNSSFEMPKPNVFIGEENLSSNTLSDNSKIYTIKKKFSIFDKKKRIKFSKKLTKETTKNRSFLFSRGFSMKEFKESSIEHSIDLDEIERMMK
jgi:DNA polymerase-3 subunit epsilon